MKAIYTLILLSLSTAAFAHKLNYPNSCADMYKNCKDENGDVENEVSCMHASLSRPSTMTPTCREDVEKAHKIVQETKAACESEYPKKCASHRPFTPESAKCIKTKTFNAKCTELVHRNF